MVWVALPSLIWEVPRATCPGSYHGPIMNRDFESAKAGARGTESEPRIQSACVILTSALFLLRHALAIDTTRAALATRCALGGKSTGPAGEGDPAGPDLAFT